MERRGRRRTPGATGKSEEMVTQWSRAFRGREQPWLSDLRTTWSSDNTEFFRCATLFISFWEREREKAEVKEKKHHNGRRQLGADVDSPWWCEKNILKRSIKAGNSLRREKTHARRKITKICLCFTIMAVWFFNIENSSIIYSTKRANCYSHQFVKK